jgi:Tfp pilus assembly protein PilF
MAYNNRGAAYNGKHDWDRAIADFSEAVRLDPNYAAPYRHRAFAYMQKGNYAQARTDVNMALRINPNYQNAKELSAELQRRGY